MNLNVPNLKKLAELVTTLTEGEPVMTPQGELQAYTIEELAVTYRDGEFFGVSFDVLGREWSAFRTGQVMVVLNNDGAMESYELKDDALYRQLDKFIKWRTETLAMMEA